MGEPNTIPVSRFIDRLDACFNRNDMKGAQECIRFWEAEARRLNDERGLLTVLNEAVGSSPAPLPRISSARGLICTDFPLGRDCGSARPCARSRRSARSATQTAPSAVRQATA